MSMKELFEIMAEMKKLVAQNPEQARQILTQQPAMTRALFHAQMKLGMVQGQVQGGGGGGGDGFPGSGTPIHTRGDPISPVAAAPGHSTAGQICQKPYAGHFLSPHKPKHRFSNASTQVEGRMSYLV
jgi:hypothetical protein